MPVNYRLIMTYALTLLSWVAFIDSVFNFMLLEQEEMPIKLEPSAEDHCVYPQGSNVVI